MLIFILISQFYSFYTAGADICYENENIAQ